MSVERKNPLKRDQALNDASNGQLGDEPRSTPEPDPQPISDLRISESKQHAKCLEIFDKIQIRVFSTRRLGDY
jgi:hypothetical protein